MKELAKKVNLLEPMDVNKISIQRDHYFPNAYLIDLPLSAIPDHVWLDIFENEWKSSRHLWDRKLFVVGDKLRLITTVEDVEEKIKWVRQIVNQTNKGVDEYNQEINARLSRMEEEIKKQVLEDESKIEKIREILRASAIS